MEITEFDKKIYVLYEENNSIYKTANKLNCSALFVLKTVGRINKEKRTKSKSICKGCRWSPCIGAPCCYRKEIDGDKSI